ncbi:MAG: PHP domain-containing protein [Spirochaetes bacterium]|nr:PHP domain-containing protein [Spirochaetota bacterium]
MRLHKTINQLKNKNAARFVDLHTHTNVSDGELSPEELVREAFNLKYKVIGITDHDTLNGIERARMEAEKFGLEIIPGCELTAYYYGHEIHILAYFIEPDHQELNSYLLKFQRARYTRARQIIKKLKKLGIDINFDNMVNKYNSDAIGRPHIAREIVSMGIESDMQMAFKKYMIPGAPAYIPKFMISPKEIISLILKADGVPVFAHPYYYFNVESIISRLVQYGLKGIEVYHSYHSPSYVRKFKQMASRFDLVQTGGSDAHSRAGGKYLPFGRIALGQKVIKNLKTIRDRIRFKSRTLSKII